MGAGFSGLELATTQYPRIYFLIWRHSKDFWVYCFVYGVIAAVAMLVYPTLAHEGALKITALGFSIPLTFCVASPLFVQDATPTRPSQSYCAGAGSCAKPGRPITTTTTSVTATVGIETAPSVAHNPPDYSTTGNRVTSDMSEAWDRFERTIGAAAIDPS